MGFGHRAAVEALSLDVLETELARFAVGVGAGCEKESQGDVNALVLSNRKDGVDY